MSSLGGAFIPVAIFACKIANHVRTRIDTSLRSMSPRYLVQGLCRRELPGVTNRPTENYVHDVYVDNTHIELSLWDTAGQEEFDRLRSLSYSDTHTIMLCFSVSTSLLVAHCQPLTHSHAYRSTRAIRSRMWKASG
jgi:GTPase SAR1 family protein